MMTQIMKKHLKKKKGFTLIEVVVVLVILAILAAIAIPALVGYIDDANARAATTEARTSMVGLQHLASTDKTDNGVAMGASGSYFTTASGGAISAKGITQINKLTGETYTSGGSYTSGTTGDISTIVISGDKVTGFKYSNGKYSVTYASGVFQKPVKL